MQTSQMCDVLSECGLGSMVALAYSPASLKSFCKEQLDAHGDVPEQLKPLLNYVTLPRLRMRKV